MPRSNLVNWAAPKEVMWLVRYSGESFNDWVETILYRDEVGIYAGLGIRDGFEQALTYDSKRIIYWYLNTLPKAKLSPDLYYKMARYGKSYLNKLCERGVSYEKFTTRAPFYITVTTLAWIYDKNPALDLVKCFKNALRVNSTAICEWVIARKSIRVSPHELLLAIEQDRIIITLWLFAHEELLDYDPYESLMGCNTRAITCLFNSGQLDVDRLEAAARDYDRNDILALINEE